MFIADQPGYRSAIPVAASLAEVRIATNLDWYGFSIGNRHSTGPESAFSS